MIQIIENNSIKKILLVFDFKGILKNNSNENDSHLTLKMHLHFCNSKMLIYKSKTTYLINKILLSLLYRI